MSAVAEVEDVSVTTAWNRLEAEKASVLVDVRTSAEWTYVGVPELESLGKRVMLAEWQAFPDQRVVPDFAAKLIESLAAQGAGPNTEIFFICRSGVRSRSAALAMAAAGFTRCRNVAGGFEGPVGPDGHRGHVSGWKAAGLPWVQG